MTDLPLSSMFFKHWAPDDLEVGVLVAKARFQRQEDGRFRAVSAPDLNLTDVFDGDPAWTPLTDEQDIAPGKFGTDLSVRAIARSMDREARQDWGVSVAIPDRLHYAFSVRGPARWEHHRLRSWQRSAPERVHEVPLSYALAYGGHVATGNDDVQIFEDNPAGIGFMTADGLREFSDFPVPQIGALGDFMVDDPLHVMDVHGLAPVAKAWTPRRTLAGTFDDEWKRERHPRMPVDYDLRFWNAAPRPLQLSPPLGGGEQIQLTGLSSARDPIHIALPNRTLVAQLTGRAPARAAMGLDTVVIDVMSETPTDHSLDLVWRTQIAHPQGYTQAELISEKPES